jgi:dipeptidase E
MTGRPAQIHHAGPQERHIVAIGGGWLPGDEARPLADYVLALAGKERPRVCFVPTASSEPAHVILDFYDELRDRADVSHLSFFPWPPEDLRGLALEQDVIYVGGGNTANMLAVWRVHGFDRVLREAWEAGVTDSFGPQLEGLRDGLGFLSGSACPHYDGEERRRPVYQELVGESFPPGVAADDLVGLHYVGEELAEAVTAIEGSSAYRVEPGSETPIETRYLAP